MLIDRSGSNFLAADHPGNIFGWFGKTASCLELNGESKNVRMKRSEMVDGTTCAVDDRETQRRGNILLQMSQTIQVDLFFCKQAPGGVTLSRFLFGAHVRQIQHLVNLRLPNVDR